MARKLASEINTALDLAAALARGGNASAGVGGVVALLEATENKSAEQAVMEGATERGFGCEYHPVNGQMGVRVWWSNKS